MEAVVNMAIAATIPTPDHHEVNAMTKAPRRNPQTIRKPTQLMIVSQYSTRHQLVSKSRNKGSKNPILATFGCRVRPETRSLIEESNCRCDSRTTLARLPGAFPTGEVSSICLESTRLQSSNNKPRPSL